MTSIRVLMASVLFGGASLLFPQENPAPQKTGSVSGTVVDEKSGEGIAKALVIIRRDQEGGVGQFTDADGKFTLRDLDPGTYTLSVERDRYVAARGQSQTVSVQAGQTTANVKLKLQRTGTLSGRVVGGDGEPVSGVNVVAAPARQSKGVLRRSWSAVTNDRGEYRIFDIAPGEYRVSATYAPRIRDIGVRMQRRSGAGGGDSGDEAYPTVYYPATLDLRLATVVSVAAGAELHGFDVQLVRATGVRVRGRVAPPAGGSPAPVFQVVTLVPAGRMDSPPQTHEVLVRDAKGEFEFSGVMPGTYRLQLETGGINESGRMSARRTLTVGVTDLEGIELTPGPPASLSGRVVAPEGRKLSPGLIVMLGSREVGDSQGGGMAQVGADGAFTMQQVAPGVYDVLIGTAGEGDDTYVQSIRIGDVDALEEGVRVGDTPLAPLHIVLKANGGTAECAAKDEKGEPVPGANVLLVPDAPRRQQAALFGECRAKADGTCRIQGITPGEYHVYAFPEGTEIDRRDPEALKPFEKNSEAVKFAEGERRVVSLKMTKVE
jgi:protocatechuate 3,4-dioxygenase beta subunit